MWWLAGQAVLGAMQQQQSSNLQSIQTNRTIVQQNAQTVQGAIYQTYALQDQVATNDAMLDANTKNMVLANYKAGLINLAKAQAVKVSASQQSGVSKQRLEALGSATANAAAAGTIGSSVDAVASDIERSAGEAQIALQDDLGIQNMNFEQQMQDLYGNAINGIYTPKVSRYTSADSLTLQGFDEGITWGQAIQSSALSVAGSYAMRRMNLNTQSQDTSGLAYAQSIMGS